MIEATYIFIFFGLRKKQIESIDLCVKYLLQIYFLDCVKCAYH